MIGRLLVNPDSVVLTNRLLERRLIPQYLQEDCTAEQLAIGLTRLIDDPKARAEQTEASETVRAMLTNAGEDPGQTAAAAVLKAVGWTTAHRDGGAG